MFGLAFDHLRDMRSQSHSASLPFRLTDRDGTINFGELVSAGRRMWPSSHLMGDERQ